MAHPCLLYLAISWSSATAGYLWAIILIYLLTVGLTLYGLARQKPLAPSHDSSLKAADVPHVSILVPVRNEEHRVLRESFGSILSQDYRRFEVIAVNDRSTDATGAILHAIAKTDARLRVIEGTEPPAGWLGKPHAMQQALREARGDWVLATDADMIFDESTLRTAMAHVLSLKVDALTLIPHFESRSFWERVVIPAWAWVLLIVAVLYRVNHPRSPRALGIGGFFLLRRNALKRIGDYERLKDEVAEDFRLAEMLKRSGASLRIEFAPQLLRTRMYRNFLEMWECHAKNWFAGANYSLAFAIAAVLAMYAVGVVPPLIAVACAWALAAGADAELWRLFIPAALAWLIQVFVLALFNRRFKAPLAYALLAPLGLALLYAVLLESSLRIKTGMGVYWKGRKIYERAGVRPPAPHQ
ncbi:MAG TPA: glycosyltransferase family 2 protein [Pyrinomonadaceae bacterium]|nr:glycosyltransferase family 2 protein [Pyrinomonadaceae bacterium]